MAEPFNTDEFQKKLQTSTIGRRIIYTDVTGSTMDDARKHGIQNGAEYPHGTVVMAERQTKARGARDHKWDASNTGNIYVSIILHMPRVYKTFDGRFDLEVSACIALYNVARSLGVEAIPKWPNDLWVRGHKLAGFLVEDGRFDIEDSNLCLVILGMGINVNADIRRNTELFSIATSFLCERNGQALSREDFFADVCLALEQTLMTRSDNFKIYRDYNLFQKGNDVSVTCASENRIINGEFLEICDNYDIKFIDKKTKAKLQGRSDFYSVKPKVNRKILVVSSGSNASKCASVVVTKLTSVVDTSKHVVCCVPEHAVTQSDEWMTTCDLLVLTEDICDSIQLSSKLIHYLKGSGNLMATGVASYFIAKMLEIPFKEGVLESMTHDPDVSVITVENTDRKQPDEITVHSDDKPVCEHITFLTSLVYFKFKETSEMKCPAKSNENQPKIDYVENIDENVGQRAKPQLSFKYYPTVDDDDFSTAITTTATSHGGHIVLFGFDLGVGFPSSFISSEESTKKILNEVETDKFKRDCLFGQILRILNVN